MNQTQIDEAPGRTALGIRRPGPADLAALSDFFAGLSLRTRVLRFFAPISLGPALLRRLSGGTDGVNAVVAVAGGARPGGVGAAASGAGAAAGGVIVGHAMACDRAGARGEQTTDIGVVVADGWQGQGVGSALMRALIARAQARGVTSIAMDVLPENHDVLAMIAGHWPAARTDRSGDCVTIHAPLPAQREHRYLMLGPAVTAAAGRTR